MTPFVQPLDAGIIHCFKAHYRVLFCQWVLELDAIGEEDIFKIDICEAMLMAKEAWDAVQPMTIEHCWNHTGIQHDPIMLCIPAAKCVLGHAIDQASLEAWNVLEDLAMSQKTLPKAEEGLEKIYGGTYKDSVWWPALAAITRSETTEDVLNELAKFKAAESRINNVNEGNRQREEVETELMDAVTELKVRWHIFGPLPSLEDLVNPPGKLEISEDPNRFTNDADIVEAVRKGVIEEGGIDDEINECSPPQMS